MESPSTISLRSYWLLLVNYLRKQKWRVILLTGLLLFNIGIQLANPQIVRYFLDSAETGRGLSKLLTAAGLFMAIAILNQLIKIAVTYIGQNVAWTATNELRADLALHCLKLDMSFHKKFKPGELIERVDGDVNQLANFFSQMVIQLGGNFLLVAGILILLAWQDWRIGIWTSTIAVMGLLSLARLNKIVVPRWQNVREADAQLYGYIEEWLNGTEEIRTNAAQPYIMLQLFKALRNRWHKFLSAMRIQVIIADIPVGVFAMAYVGAHILGYTLLMDKQMTIGEIYLVFYYIDVLKGPLWEILRQIEDLQRAAASINRIAELRNIQPTITDGHEATIPTGSLALAFENVSFHYEDDPSTDILCNLTFTLKPGMVLGLLGRTGSGKTTLTKLILRLHDPSFGAIYLGNKRLEKSMPDIRQVTQDNLRERIGMVSQDVQLFRASVRQNVTLFDETISDTEVVKVLSEVGLENWLFSLPRGLETVIDSSSSNVSAGISGGMSAGEAQLLAFGRVLLSNPGLVILDEASSRLDKATEKRIENALDRLLENRTGIIIAHRLSSVQRADEIMILEDGQIIEHGNRIELAQDPNSKFYNLLQTGLEEALV